jgi:putative membrane protein
MAILSKVLIGLVAFIHLYFLTLQMFLWTKPFGLNTFKMTLDDALIMEKLASNQGLYNSFLAAGLIAGLISRNTIVARTLFVFCLTCVITAGLYGAWSVAPRIFFIQSVPAILALLTVFKISSTQKI